MTRLVSILARPSRMSWPRLRLVGRWAAWLWLGSLALAVLLVAPALWVAKSAVAGAREAVARHDYSAAVTEASRVGVAAGACRVALVMPASLTLRVLPVVGTYVHAAGLGCGIASDAARAATSDAVGMVASDLTVARARHSSVVSAQLVDAAARAVAQGKPYLMSVAVQLQELAALDIAPSLRARLQSLASRVTPAAVEEYASVSGVAPALVGVDRPRTYFVALLSNAEMRATLGFLGQYAIVRFDKGKPTILQVGSNAALKPLQQQYPGEFAGASAIIGTGNPEWVNTTLSPHGPDAAVSWLKGWEAQTGQRLDGAIGLDVTLASRIAAALGESLTRADGTRVSTAQGIADYAQNGVYFDFPTQSQASDARKAFQLRQLVQLLASAGSSLLNPDVLLNVLPSGLAENRVLLYFADPSLQARIAGSFVAQDLRVHADRVHVTFNNGSGNKFDFYLRLAGRMRCDAMGGAELRLTVHSAADPKVQYPPYIGQRLDKPSETRASTYDQFLWLLPKGSRVRWVALDGVMYRPHVVSLGGRPVLQLPFEVRAGQTRKVDVNFTGAVKGFSIQGQPFVPTQCAAE